MKYSISEFYTRSTSFPLVILSSDGNLSLSSKNFLPRGFLKQPSVDSKARGGVGGLTQESSRKARVESCHAFGFHYMFDHVEAGLVFLARGYLHPVLDQVQRLYKAGGPHAVKCK